MNDDAYMRLCLIEAERAARLGEVPVGAVVVVGDRIVGRGHNLRETTGDPTAHAEVVALREAARSLGHWRILDATLYVTLEPCAMCAGALVNARVKRLVYGCVDPKAGAVESVFDIPREPRLNHRLIVEGGLRASECAEVLRQFFRSRRS
ncbi:MAG: nucleoside deaminase [Myxococcales bacterium]|nr:nucleoside deaminase [Myxococcales bacterium]